VHPPSLFDFLDSPAGAPLRARFHERALDAGALFQERDDKDHILVVKRGRLRVYLATPERELSLVYLSQGDVFSTHTRAQLQAVESTTLLLAPRGVIERELAHFPALQAAVIRVLAMVLNQAMTQIEDLAFYQVRARIARYILRCAARKKTDLEPGLLLRLDLNMEEIAALLGTTRQTASSELNAMIRLGAIARRGRGQLVIVAPDQLRAWASDEKLSAG
jgi:CRP-like cAMP-binding protein